MPTIPPVASKFIADKKVGSISETSTLCSAHPVVVAAARAAAGASPARERGKAAREMVARAKAVAR